jgi:hypothetical protein
VQRLPGHWSKQNLDDQLKKAFFGHTFRTHSLCKHHSRPTKTALVTFNSPIPETLSSLANGLTNFYELDAGGHAILLRDCLGLTTLYEPQNGNFIAADILFVHGLSGHAIGSWTAPNGKCWPRDFLGNDLKTVRIISFGYEARLDRDTSTSQLSDWGGQLIRNLEMLRGKAEHQNRPLFLVGHSFGGTIINWVLHELSTKKQNPGYENTLNAIRCVTFFGTPHHGMSIQYLEPVAEQRKHDAMKRTLHDLAADSEMLKMLGDAMRSLKSDVKFITCIEQKMTNAPTIDGQPPAAYHAVNRRGAEIYSQQEILIPIHADHREMIKFSSDEDRHYEQVLQRLKEALEGCRQIRNDKIMTQIQRERFLQHLWHTEMEQRQKEIKVAHDTTCEWPLETVEYQNWRTPSKDFSNDEDLFWIHGGSGSGKSTLLKHIFTHHQSRHQCHLIMAFFFNSQGTELQKTAKGMYQSLFYQVLKKTEKFPSEVGNFNQGTQDRLPNWSNTALKEVLEYCIPILGRPIFCYIDALDECCGSDVHDITAFFARLTKKCRKNQVVFRVCLSSIFDPSISGPGPRAVSLEQQEGHRQGIVKYAEHKLQIGHDNLSNRVYQMLKEKSHGNFLWAKLVVDMLRKVPDWDRGSLLEKLHEIPSDLLGLFRHILTLVSPDDQPRLLMCLKRMIHTKALLTVKELYLMLLSGTSKTDLTAFHELPPSSKLEKYILKLCQGLVEIVGSQVRAVQFVHPSIPNFLLDDEDIQILLAQLPMTPNLGSDSPAQSSIESFKNDSSTTNGINGNRVPEITHTEHEFDKTFRKREQLSNQSPGSQSPRQLDSSKHKPINQQEMEHYQPNLHRNADLHFGQNTRPEGFLDTVGPREGFQDVQKRQSVPSYKQLSGHNSPHHANFPSRVNSPYLTHLPHHASPDHSATPQYQTIAPSDISLPYNEDSIYHSGQVSSSVFHQIPKQLQKNPTSMQHPNMRNSHHSLTSGWNTPNHSQKSQYYGSQRHDQHHDAHLAPRYSSQHMHPHGMHYPNQYQGENSALNDSSYQMHPLDRYHQVAGYAAPAIEYENEAALIEYGNEAYYHSEPEEQHQEIGYDYDGVEPENDEESSSDDDNGEVQDCSDYGYYYSQ